MSLALQRLKNIGWMALVFLVAILLYPLSLNVAALHSDLVSVDKKILNAKREISFLQAELRTRASMAQLEEWNDLLYGYQPPTAEQFLDGEKALAGLGGSSPASKPVMVAVSESDGALPAGIVGDSPFAPLNSDTKMEVRKLALAGPEKKVEEPIVKSRTERLAEMDAKLLSDDFLSEIDKRSQKERRR